MNIENPYSSPSESQSVKPQGEGKLVPQVRIVAILMMIQAVVEILYGLYCGAMGFVMPALMAGQQNQIPAEQQEMFNTVFYSFFFVTAALGIFIGTLRLVAGILGVTYRGRTLGIVSHIGGFLTIATCYCFPTAIALGIYGCIVYFNVDVAKAFELRSRGYTSEQILAHFKR